MKNIFNKVLLLCTFSFIFTPPAHAYLDPGTGSYIFQILIATFAGAIFAIKMFWNNLKTFFATKFSKNKNIGTGDE